MSEWWTYRLHDFLMFSPRTYTRMFELYNEAIWPINALAALLAFALLFVATRLAFPGSNHSSTRANHDAWQRWLRVAVFTYFAVTHVWIAFVFLRQHYAPIFWAANYFALAFMAQAALFAFATVVALLSRNAFCFTRSQPVAVISVVIVSLALLVHPAALFATQNHAGALEWVGVAPDPTAIGALGFLLLLRPGGGSNAVARIARYLWFAMIASAVAACLISVLTLLAMQTLIALVPALAVTIFAISFFADRPIEAPC
jgi:hypothetical protein